MTSRQEIVSVQLADGTKIHIKATILGGEEDVAVKLLSFDEVTDTIEHVSNAPDGCPEEGQTEEGERRVGQLQSGGGVR